ncbi:hypothetical protein ACFPYI_00115 [Halomarina salina]|uniref:Uncharacterized protein n=1 Tax=Halomarina salina TaxID=1872699 RepID=A0ABD5RGR9_9EURY|nr:hypothetical protein [Halomarina salina]
MDRRTFIGTVGAGIAATIAGCTDAGSGGDGDGGGDGGDGQTGTDATGTTTGTERTETPTDPTETTGSGETTDADGTTDDTSTESTPDTTAESPGTGTDEGTGTASGSLAVVDTSFEVTSSECGGGVSEATVSVDSDTVSIDGTIGGRNGCDTARIAGTTVESGTLTVSVERYTPESEDPTACVDCLTDIEYTSSVTIEGTPDTVVVNHGDEQVAKTSA